MLAAQIDQDQESGANEGDTLYPFNFERFSKKKLSVLLVEDDDADAYLIRRVLANHPRVDNIIHLRDGVEAMDAINGETVSPDLAIVDLQMPRKNGFSLLLDLAAQERPAFPIVVLTSSRHGADAFRAKRRGAERFITKPNTLEKLADVLEPIFADL